MPIQVWVTLWDMYPFIMYLDEHVAGCPDGGAVDDLAAALLHDHVEEGGAQVRPDVAVAHHQVAEEHEAEVVDALLKGDSIEI